MNKKFQDIQAYASYLEKWIRSEVKKAGASGVVFGLSGGIDSAVIAGIAKRAFKDSYQALIMHMQNSTLDKKCTQALVKQMHLNYVDLDLLASANLLAKSLMIDSKKDATVFANIKARLRMVSLYAIAQKHGYLVCGTSNYDEWQTGYFTKYGDSACDLAPLRNCLKSDVYELAQYYGVPQIVINRAPSASLLPNQSDEQDLKIKYLDLDNYFKKLKTLSLKDATRLKELNKKSQHKRMLAPAPLPRWNLK